MKRSIVQPILTLVIAFLIVLGGTFIFAGQASQEADGKVRQALALHQAQSLATLIASGRAAGADDGQISAQLFEALAKSDRQLDRVRYVERQDKKLIASNFPDDSAIGPLPRVLTLPEKKIFDPILLLPDLGKGLGYSDTHATAAAPIILNGARNGYVEVERVSPHLLSVSWLDIKTLLGLILLFCGAASLVIWRPKFTGWIGIAVAFLAMALCLQAVEGQSAAIAKESLKQVVAQATHFSDSTVASGQRAGWTLVSAMPVVTDEILGRAKPSKQDLGNSLKAVGMLAALLAAYVGFGGAAATWRAFKENPSAYLYVAPALFGMLALAFFPFFYGFLLSFTDTTLLNQSSSWGERWVGLSNYVSILNDFKFGGSGDAFNYQNFYWTLGVTVLWTVTNVVLGVGIGLMMALLLNVKGLKGVAIYRTLLILPWAIPNYITALTWKGMFHPQFGAINQAIQAFGGQPVQWFDSFGPSFITGLATNAWLSFPFMMVVSLGALQAVDEDMYEAARIDGASPWQQFWHITLPSLRPALLPAIIVSVVWTFNMFNVIYLVSAGQPSGSNEILVTRAYKIAFEEYRYGYAAAYSVVIFMILLVYGVFQIRATAATEANNK